MLLSLYVCVCVCTWVSGVNLLWFVWHITINITIPVLIIISGAWFVRSFVRSFIRCLFTCLLAPVLQHHLRLQCKALMHNTLLALYSPVLVGSCYKISGLAPSLIYETTIAFNRPNLFIYNIYNVVHSLSFSSYGRSNTNIDTHYELERSSIIWDWDRHV